MKKLSKFSYLHTSLTRVDPGLEAVTRQDGLTGYRVNAYKSLFVDGLTPGSCKRPHIVCVFSKFHNSTQTMTYLPNSQLRPRSKLFGIFQSSEGDYCLLCFAYPRVPILNGGCRLKYNVILKSVFYIVCFQKSNYRCLSL